MHLVTEHGIRRIGCQPFVNAFGNMIYESHPRNKWCVLLPSRLLGAVECRLRQFIDNGLVSRLRRSLSLCELQESVLPRSVEYRRRSRCLKRQQTLFAVVLAMSGNDPLRRLRRAALTAAMSPLLSAIRLPIGSFQRPRGCFQNPWRRTTLKEAVKKRESPKSKATFRVRQLHDATRKVSCGSRRLRSSSNCGKCAASRHARAMPNFISGSQERTISRFLRGLPVCRTPCSIVQREVRHRSA